jgi:hypothetical protein
MTQRILILSHDNKIGDAIVATGLFKPLRAHWPNCEIGVLCGGSNAALYRHHPDVRWLHVSNSRNVFARIWASVKARWVGYDMVVHFGLNLANPSEQIVLRVVNAKQRFLFAKHPAKPLPNDVVMDGEPEEHIREVARVLSRYVDAIAVRAFPKFQDWQVDRQDKVIEAFARFATVPVINMETITHPCQELALMLALQDRLVTTDRKKFVLTWTYHPKPLNTAVANSGLVIAAKFGFDVTLLCPTKDYVLDERYMKAAERFLPESPPWT